jgi:hypothetical protein
MSSHIEKHQTGLSAEHLQHIWQNQVDGAAEILDFLADDRLDLVNMTCMQFADYALAAHAMLCPDGLAYGMQRFARCVMSAAEMTVGSSKTVVFEADPPATAVILTAIPNGDAFITHGKLLDAFFAAHLCRDHASLQRFAALNLSALNSTSASSSEQAIALASVVQQSLQGKAGVIEQAASLVQQCSPISNTDNAAQTYITFIIGCQAEILFRMLDPGTTAELANKTLMEALLSHQHYYTLGEANKGGDPRDCRSYFCIHANAFAAWMHDFGLVRTVTSDYLSEDVLSQRTVAGPVLVR